MRLRHLCSDHFECKHRCHLTTLIYVLLLILHHLGLCRYKMYIHVVTYLAYTLENVINFFREHNSDCILQVMWIVLSHQRAIFQMPFVYRRLLGRIVVGDKFLVIFQCRFRVLWKFWFPYLNVCLQIKWDNTTFH